MLVAGIALFALAYIVLAGTGPSIARILGGFVLAGVGIGCVETAEHAAVATLAPTDLRGSTFGLLAAVQSFGHLAASAGAGALWTLIFARGGLHLRRGCMVLALGLFVVLRTRG